MTDPILKTKKGEEFLFAKVCQGKRVMMKKWVTAVLLFVVFVVLLLLLSTID